MHVGHQRCFEHWITHVWIFTVIVAHHRINRAVTYIFLMPDCVFLCHENFTISTFVCVQLFDFVHLFSFVVAGHCGLLCASIYMVCRGHARSESFLYKSCKALVLLGFYFRPDHDTLVPGSLQSVNIPTLNPVSLLRC